MKIMIVTVSLGLVGCEQEAEFDIEDDATDAEIEEIAKDTMFSLIEWNYSEKHKKA